MSGPEKPYSALNRTLRLTEADKKKYAHLCKNVTTETKAQELVDSVFCADIFDALDFFPRKYFDLVIADPPYFLAKTFGQKKFNPGTEKEYMQYTERWVKKVIPLLKENATIYVCSDWGTSLLIAPVLKEHCKIRNRITWEREKGRGAKKNWKNSHEDIWFCTVSDDYYFDAESVKLRKRIIAPYKKNGNPKGWAQSDQGNYRMTGASNLFTDITVPYWSMPENTEHPTQKPEKLIAKLLLASSPEGAHVLDLFSGTGATSVTAKKLGRHFTAIEAECDYAMLALKRLEKAQTDKRIQGFSNNIFHERNTQG